MYENDTKWLFDGIWSYTCLLHKTSFRILSLTNNYYNKQFHQNKSGNSLESLQCRKRDYQWSFKTTNQYPFYQYYQDLQKNCFRANYQLYWKETNRSLLPIWPLQESFNCNAACQMTRWHQKNNESQRSNINSLYRLLKSIWYY